MTLFIYEHLTSGALAGEAISPSLLREGDVMLKALCADLTELDCQITVMRDSRLPALADPTGRISVLPVNSLQEYRHIWQQSLQRYDQFLMIAPETDGLLEQLVSELDLLNKAHLGCSASVIALCSDKLKCSRWLHENAFLSPETFAATEWIRAIDIDKQADWIIKPRDGAGCEQTFKLPTQAAISYLKSRPASELETCIIQPFIEGTALSLSLFVTAQELHVLSVNRQHIDESEHQLQLVHCEAGRDDLIEPAAVSRLTQQIHATMPGLWGFVGIDLIQTSDALWLIEINPRLTVSYAEPALRQQANPARHLKPFLKED